MKLREPPRGHDLVYTPTAITLKYHSSMSSAGVVGVSNDF